jgi:hypothetical protein
MGDRRDQRLRRGEVAGGDLGEAAHRFLGHGPYCEWSTSQ